MQTVQRGATDMNDHITIHRDPEGPVQDIDDLIFGDQTELLVSDR